LADTVLIILGGIIALGFLGHLFFDRTKIPDIIFLIGIGLLLGPALKIVPPEAVRPAMPYFGAIALAIILFEGGLDLDLYHVMGQAGRALLLLFLSFGLSLVLLYFALSVGLEITGIPGWATAVALSCTSAPILIPILAKIVPASPLRPLIATESSLSDALAVILVLSILQVESTAIYGHILAANFLLDVAVSLVLALLAGWFWLWMLSHFSQRPFFSFLTVGFVFLLVGLIESLGGSGAVAALAFGVALSNGEAFAGLWGPRNRDRIAASFRDHHLLLDPKIRGAQAEISLLVRSFFFVYMGVVFQGFGLDAVGWLTTAAIFMLILAARFLAVRLLALVTHTPLEDQLLLTAMISRGLATAVLASIIASHWEEYASPIRTITFLIIVLSNIWMTGIIFMGQRTKREAALKQKTDSAESV